MLAELGLKDEAFADDASGGLQSPHVPFPRPRDAASSSRCSTSICSRARCHTRSWCNGSSTSWCARRSRIIEGSGIAEVRFSTKVTGLVQSADHVDVTVINAGGETETLRGALRHRHRRRPQHRAALAEIEFEGFTWAERFIKIATSFDFGTPARVSAPATISPTRASGSTCSRSGRAARPASGAASCRLPADESRRAGPEHGTASSAGCSGIHAKQRRLRDPVLRALCRASAGGRNLQQGPRAARRRQRACQQSDRRHGHERRHP